METFIVFFLSYFIEAIIFWAYSDTFFPAKFSPLIRTAFLSASYAILLGFSFLLIFLSFSLKRKHIIPKKIGIAYCSYLLRLQQYLP